MSYSLSESVLPLLSQGIEVLQVLVNKAEAYAQEKNIPVTDLLNARLIDDMKPFTFQIHSATDTAAKGINRLLGTEPEQLNDSDLKTIDDVKARIAKVREIIKSADRAAIDGRVDASFTMGLGGGRTADVQSKQYVSGYTIPNFFFHLQTAYAILRHKGVALGKSDYIASFMAPFMKQA